MIAFEGWPEGPVLHTGDFRFHEGMREDPVLCRLAGGSVRCQMLHLDTTCAHESLARLPSKDASINVLLDLLDRHASENVFLHSHGLGDEALLHAVARYLPSGKLLFADERRYAEILITDPAFCAQFCARIMPGELLPVGRLVIVVPNSRTRGSSAFRSVLGIEVSCSTLWWAKRTQDGDSTGDCALPLLDRYGVWHILWSMHSSLVELQAIVSLMRPIQVRAICQALVVDSRTLAGVSSFIAELCGLPVVELQDMLETSDAPLSPAGSTGKSVWETAAETREFFTAQAMPTDTLAHLLADDDAPGFSSSLLASRPGPSRGLLRAHSSRASTTEIDQDSDCTTTLPDVDSPEPSRRLLRARSTNTSVGSSSPILRPRKAARH